MLLNENTKTREPNQEPQVVDNKKETAKIFDALHNIWSTYQEIIKRQGDLINRLFDIPAPPKSPNELEEPQIAFLEGELMRSFSEIHRIINQLESTAHEILTNQSELENI